MVILLHGRYFFSTQYLHSDVSLFKRTIPHHYHFSPPSPRTSLDAMDHAAPAAAMGPSTGVVAVKAPAAETSRGGAQTIGWETVLPRRCLRVLLVENDDSTRQLVAALLRKCGYQVAAVADGLKAWDLLMEKSYRYDLVLTEVMMPLLSGIGLLAKIMGNEISRNIPVIMMSSHDSIGIVFKCMLKGAVDFLVKPVRKNELKNLWQHVWRKYCSNRCRNESDNQIIFEAVSENGATNNYSCQNVDNKLDTMGDAHREIDTQSTCSKPDNETRQERARSEPLQTEHESFSRKIASKFEKYSSGPLVLSKTSSTYAAKEEKAMSTDNIQENSSANRSPRRNGDAFSLRSKEDAGVNPDCFCHSKGQNESSKEFVGFIRTIATGQCSYWILEDNSFCKDVSCEAVKISDVNRGVCSFSSSLLREHSLKSLQVNNLDEKQFRESRKLNHSVRSAFSRYVNMRQPSLPKSGVSLSNSCFETKEGVSHQIPEPVGEGPCTVKCVPVSSKGMPSSAISNEEIDPSTTGTSKDDVYKHHSSSQEAYAHPHGALSLPVPNMTLPIQGWGAGYGALLQPVFYSEPSFSLCSSAVLQNPIEVMPSNQTVCGDGQHFGHFNCQHFKQHHRPYQLQGVNDEMFVKESSDPQFVLHAAKKLNRSCSYSQSKQNGYGSNRTNEDINEGMNGRVVLERGNEGGYPNKDGQRLDRERAQREAALTKFRLKRKDRCYQKKVRYHSRKKLAEQRPRVKGQFVRQSVPESTTTGTDTDD